MKLKLALVGTLLSLSAFSNAMMFKIRRYKMPTAEVLSERLKKHELFLQKSDIIGQLAQKELTAGQIYRVVDKAVTDYYHECVYEQKKEIFCSRDMQQTNPTEYLNARKRTVLALLLQDNPELLRRVEHLAKTTAKL